MISQKKKIKFIYACLGFILCASTSIRSLAQDVSNTSTSAIKRDTVNVETGGKYPVVTNTFWDNWFAGAGAGTQIYFGDHNKQMDLGERFSPAFSLYAGKWFSPGIGVRAGLAGFKVNGLTQNNSYTTGEVYDPSKRLKRQEIKFFHLHADVLFNLTNILKGYQADRVYSLSPYLGVGWVETRNKPRTDEVSANIGLYNALRLSAAWDLTLDLQGALVDDRFDGETGNRMGEGTLGATLGIAYKFKERGWQKPKTTIITYDDAELLALRDKVSVLEKDNDALNKQLADAKTPAITDLKLERSILAAPILVTFPINSSMVSNEARVNLGYFAEAIKKGHAAVVYKITGYADKGTGTPAVNQRLSRKRAEAIYNVLAKEFGISTAQLELAYEGGVDNLFYDDPRLSRAVITIAK